MAEANEPYPSILGMVGLRLHISDETSARKLEKRVNSRKGLNYSLVRNHLSFLQIVPWHIAIKTDLITKCHVVSYGVVSYSVVFVFWDVVSCCVGSFRVMPCPIMSCYVALRCVVSCRFVQCRVVSYRVVLCRVMSCYVVSYRIVSCRVVSCYIVSCRVMSTSCRAVPCVSCCVCMSYVYVYYSFFCFFFFFFFFLLKVVKAVKDKPVIKNAHQFIEVAPG